MNNELIKNVMEQDKEAFVGSFVEGLSEKLNLVLEEKRQEIASKMMETVEDVSEESAFAEVITEAIEHNSVIRLDLMNEERIEITPEIASLLSEAHDDLPPELQKSFRDMVFESKEKFISLLESIQTGE